VTAKKTGEPFKVGCVVHIDRFLFLFVPLF
jgi:hypothetical protein